MRFKKVGEEYVAFICRNGDEIEVPNFPHFPATKDGRLTASAYCQRLSEKRLH